MFEIKSATHTAEHLDSRVESFVNCAATYLRKLPRAEFESRRDELCKDILEPPSSLDEAADELWGGVTRRDGVFDGTPTLQANAVRTVSKEDVIHWWDMHVMSETQSRTKLSVWIEASVTPNDAGGGSGQQRASETTSPVPSESSDDASSEDGNESDEVESSITFPSDSPFRAVGWAASSALLSMYTPAVSRHLKLLCRCLRALDGGGGGRWKERVEK